uniref:Uncharacterized protein n=1 Tax=viral metagenome TaxID=1070528 RepID=A0A6C0E4A4_9ZZZZ
MQYICPVCKLVPSSHSLAKVSENNGIIYYYTCPSKAILYYDVKGKYFSTIKDGCKVFILCYITPTGKKNETNFL